MQLNKKNSILRRMFLDAKPIRWWLALAAAVDILAVVTAVEAPEMLGDIVQILYDTPVQGFSKDLRGRIISYIGILLAVYGVNGICSYVNMHLMNRVVSKHYTTGLRIAISEKIRHLPVRYVDQTPVGDILNRVNQDVSEMGGYVHQLFDVLVKGVLQLGMISVAMFLEDWRLACFVVVMMPVSIAVSSWLSSKCEKHYDGMFESTGKLTELVEEAFSNYATTKAYNLEETILAKHEAINTQVYTATAKANFLGSMVQPVIRFSNAAAYILINLAGGWMMVTQGLSVGGVVTIVLFAKQFAAPLEQLAAGFSQYNRIKAAAKRVYELLNLPEETEPEDSLQMSCTGEVSFEAVNFSYEENKKLIENLQLHIYPGQKVAIVGPTGAGKTTIVNLLMRFYDPVSGRICLDGQDTRKLSRESVRSCFGMVLQDTWLFRGTIRENLAYGKPEATMDEIRSVCRQAYCDRFIRTMPQGYDTPVGEDTTNLSGGQKQLITIARALLADRPLLILDEATSNVDTRTEILIQKAMDKLMAGKTCFVIAHRLSTIVNSDLILVLDQGRIVEQGTHSQLLTQKGMYYQLYNSQYAV